MELKLMIILLLVSYASSQNEGDQCTDNYTNTVGICTKVEECTSAQEDRRKNGITPTFCSYAFDGPVVCCRDGVSILQSATRRTTTESQIPIWGNFNDDRPVQGSKRISEKKCDEYSRGVTETVDFIALLPNPPKMSFSAPKCDYSGVGLIVGGENASLGEFPHMAAVGWANDAGGYDFKCGGSLISPRFVLSAGHCTQVPRSQHPFPAIVRLGDQNIDPAVRDGAFPIDVAIRTIHKHPDYNPPERYNDIALFELAADVNFEKRIRPACLWASPSFGSYSMAVATGWGVSDVEKNLPSNELQKVSLSLLDNNYCDSLLQDITNRKWDGFRPTQLCAGELRGGKDTCQGDSGSPLQVASNENQCIFRIIGVTSFGRRCAVSGEPGIYSRVSSYLNWIEGIVWPGEQ